MHKNIGKISVFVIAFILSFSIGIRGVDAVSTQISEDNVDSESNLDTPLIDTLSSIETEVITSYDSTVIVEKNGDLRVSEKIAVLAYGNSINHGIFRDFPTTYVGEFGFFQKVPFDVVSAYMDGRPVNYWTESIENGVRVYLGSKESLISYGPHTFEIDYTTSKQLGSFEDHDELFYNITGNGWSFGIEKASATVILPFISDSVKASGYTGYQNEKGKDFTAKVSTDAKSKTTTINYTVTRELYSKEGFTVFVTWNKGLVDFVPLSQFNLADFLANNWLFPVGVVFFFGIFLFYYISWSLVGRDPKSKAIYPRFEISEKLTVGMIRYINNYSVDMKAITAAIVSIAVKGYWKISMEKKWFSQQYTVTKTGGDPSVLTEDERILVGAILLDGEASFTFEQTWYERIQLMKKSYIDHIQHVMGEGLVKTNYLYLGIGLVFAGVYFFLMFLGLQSVSPDGAFLAVLSIFTAAFGISMLINIFFVRHVRETSSFFSRFVGTIIAVVLVGAGVLSAVAAMKTFPLYIIVFWVAFFILMQVFGVALKSRSQQGADYYEEIQGFKMFLSATEEQKIKMFGKKFPMTIETFEKYLPYAIALDIEPLWSQQFENVLKGISNTEGRYWYSGSSMNFASAGFVSSFGSSMASTLSSSATAPGSSGGGFSGGSGGGGGGGGGGGW